MARRNSRGLEMSFKRAKGAKHGRWCKSIKDPYTGIAKTHYFGYGKGVTDKESYKAALEKLRVFEQEMAVRRAQVDYRIAYKTPGSFKTIPGQNMINVREWGDVYPVREFAALFDAQAGKQGAYKEFIEGTLSARLRELYGEHKRLKKLFPDISFPMLENIETKEEIKSDSTVSDMVDVFMARQKERHIIGKGEDLEGEGISDGRYSANVAYTKKFKSVVGGYVWDGTEKTATNILTDWRKQCIEWLGNKDITDNTFNSCMAIAKQFILYMKSEKRLDVVPNIKKLCKKIEVTSKAKAIPIETIRQLWASATDEEKAYMALGLNAGFKNSDVGQLEQGEVRDGYLVWVRGKTEKTANVTTTTRLWALTKELLEKTSNGKDFVFVDESGLPLVRFDENLNRKDDVASAWKRLCKRAGVEGFTFENLRDTSATYLEGNGFSHLTTKFLAHKEKAMKKYYIDKSVNVVLDRSLDDAVGYLENLYGLK